jgi:hypothetical protein
MTDQNHKLFEDYMNATCSAEDLAMADQMAREFAAIRPQPVQAVALAKALQFLIEGHITKGVDPASIDLLVNTIVGYSRQGARRAVHTRPEGRNL